jgi:hypothetical protein
MTEPHEPLTSDGLGEISVRYSGQSQLTGKSVAQRLIDDHRELELMQPPDPAQVNVPLDVDIRFATFKITDVDTVKQCGGIKIAMLWYWTDPRFVDWNPDTPLPDKLWGPDAFMTNTTSTWRKQQTQFEVHARARP